MRLGNKLKLGLILIGLGLFGVACKSPKASEDPRSITEPKDAGTSISLDATPQLNVDAGVTSFEAEALLLDFDMGPRTQWLTIEDALNEGGLGLKYRRWYPHVSLNDIDQSHPIIFVAAGSGPGHPSELMRPDDAERLVQFVNEGGMLVLMPRNTWQDSTVGTNDWYFFNRILEMLNMPTRIEQNTAIGDVSIAEGPKPPLHKDSAWAYSGPLEWTINLAMSYPAEFLAQRVPALDAFATGYVPTMMCNGEKVSALARTHADVLVWWQLGGAPEDRVALPGMPQPISILAQNDGLGAVLTLPRSIAELPTHSSHGADQPVANLRRLDQTSSHVHSIIDVAIEMTKTPQNLVHTGCQEGNTELFSPATRIATETRSTPPNIPTQAAWAEPLLELAPTGNVITQRPEWFTESRAHLAYGDLKPKVELQGMLGRARSAGVDSFVIRVESEHLLDYESDNPSPPFKNAVDVVAELGGHLFLGVHFLNPQLMGLINQTGVSKGAHDQQLNAPPPLHDLVWTQNLKPMVLNAARAAKSHPEIKGLLFDSELYNAGATTYLDGQAFDENTWAYVVRALDAQDFEIGTEALLLRRKERLPWLVDHGLVGFAYQVLEDEVARRASALRDEARAISPDFEFALYIPFARTAWFYRGLMRGWGTPEKPLLVLTYDTVTHRLRTSLQKEGIHVHLLGGLLGVLFEPLDFENALVNSGLRSDGYWLFQYGDFPDIDDPAFNETKHASPDIYWKAVEQANQRLNQEVICK